MEEEDVQFYAGNLVMALEHLHCTTGLPPRIVALTPRTPQREVDRCLTRRRRPASAARGIAYRDLKSEKWAKAAEPTPPPLSCGAAPYPNVWNACTPVTAASCSLVVSLTPQPAGLSLPILALPIG